MGKRKYFDFFREPADSGPGKASIPLEKTGSKAEKPGETIATQL
jgi:hypothetical protein